MPHRRTSRWKRADTHADLRAFLGDASSLCKQPLRAAQRAEQVEALVDQYGLSDPLAQRAMAALELSQGDSRVAYELVAQWSLAESHGELQAHLSNALVYPLPRDDEQPTADGELLVSFPPPVAAEQPSAAAATAPTASDPAPASPDTLPDLDSIVAEEAALLRAAAPCPAANDAQPNAPRQRDRYRRWLDAQLAPHAGKRLGAQHWEQLCHAGVSEHGLQAAEAAHLIQERSTRQRIQVYTPERAQQQLNRWVMRLRSRHGRINATLKRQLEASARQLGLPEHVVSHVLAAQGGRAALAGDPRQLNPRLLLAIGASAACAMLSFFLWVAISQRPAPQPQVASAGNEGPGAQRAVPPPQTVAAPAWLDASARSAMEQLAKASSAADGASVQGVLNELSASQPEVRSNAALALADAVDFTATAEPGLQDASARLLIGYLAQEPHQPAALHAFQRMAAAVEHLSARWPAHASVPAALFWRLEVLLNAVQSPHMPSARAALFAATLSETLELTFTATGDPTAWREACCLAVAERTYAMLGRSLERSSTALVEVHASVVAAARPLLPQADRTRLECKWLAALLSDPRHGSSFLPAMARQIATADLHNTLRFVAAYEQMASSPLREQVGELLMARAEVHVVPESPEQTARLVRASLMHGDRNKRFADRWAHFTFPAERLLARSQSPASELALAQGVLDLAHHNLLGAALAAPAVEGHLTYEQYVAEGAPQLGSAAAVPAGQQQPVAHLPAGDEMPPHVAKELLRRAHELSEPLPRHEQEARWEVAVRIVERWQELPPPVASRLGSYALSALDSRTETAVLRDAASLAALPEFRLALADAALASPLEEQALAARLSAMLGQRVALHTAADREHLHRALLAQVQSQLQPDTSDSATKAGPLAELRGQLTMLYRARARMAGVPSAEYLTASNPARLLEALLRHRSSAVDDASTMPGQMIPLELTAIHWRARSELEALVLMQQLSVHTQAEDLALEKPSLALAIDHRLAPLRQRATNASSLMEQLYWGQAAELQLWLLATGVQ